MCDNNNNPYHPHETYTFEGVNSSPFEGNNTTPIGTIKQLMINRPMLARGVMKLFKEDLKTNYFGCKKYLRVIHPYLMNKTGFVVFSFHDMPDSQDTKTTFSSFAIMGDDGLMNCGNILKTCKIPYLMYFGKDGYLSEYSGPINGYQLRQYVAMRNPSC